jgi:hypothetical protein
LLAAEPGGEVRLIFIAFDALDGFADMYPRLHVILDIFLSHDLQSPYCQKDVRYRKMTRAEG